MYICQLQHPTTTSLRLCFPFFSSGGEHRRHRVGADEVAEVDRSPAERGLSVRVETRSSQELDGVGVPVERRDLVE